MDSQKQGALMLRVALTVNGLAIVWVLIFMQSTAVGWVLGITAVVWFFVFLKRRQDALEEDFQKRFAGRNVKRVDKTARFRAQESHGYSQAQGMGYLVLTDEELCFDMALLDRQLVIPNSSITRVGETNRLLGVNPGRTMLKVEFKGRDGNPDSIALTVKELEAWKTAIDAERRTS